jgi:hypothetical protein
MMIMTRFSKILLLLLILLLFVLAFIGWKINSLESQNINFLTEGADRQVVEHQTELASVVSVCHSKNIDVWKISHKKILKYIKAKKYKVIVPDAEVEIFKNATDHRYEVIPETSILPHAKEILKKYMPKDIQGRLGWYLQQLLKIKALLDGNDDDIILIWDADTIPLKPLNFVNKDGKIIYYTGKEHHPPYFDLIKKIFGFDKKVNFSFIAQCFPAKVVWVKAFCKKLEDKYKADWVEAICSNIISFNGSGFSEYETLGTFFTHCFDDEISFSNKPWIRYGKSILGRPECLTEERESIISMVADHITFESWHSKRYSYLYKVMLDCASKIFGFLMASSDNVLDPHFIS